MDHFKWLIPTRCCVRLCLPSGGGQGRGGLTRPEATPRWPFIGTRRPSGPTSPGGCLRVRACSSESLARRASIRQDSQRLVTPSPRPAGTPQGRDAPYPAKEHLCPPPSLGPMPSRRDPETGLAVRGTTNRDDRGSAEDRRRRSEFLVRTYRADVDAITIPRVQAYSNDPPEEVTGSVLLGTGTPACRCYRCGVLMTARTLTADKIVPRCEGGTYRRANIRPACLTCNSVTGAALAHKKTPAKVRAKRQATEKIKASPPLVLVGNTLDT